MIHCDAAIRFGCDHRSCRVCGSCSVHDVCDVCSENGLDEEVLDLGQLFNWLGWAILVWES